MKTPRTIIVPGVFCIRFSWLGRLWPLPVSSCGSSPALRQGNAHTGPGLRDLRLRHPHTSSDGTSSPLLTVALSAALTLPPLLGLIRRWLSNHKFLHGEGFQKRFSHIHSGNLLSGIKTPIISCRAMTAVQGGEKYGRRFPHFSLPCAAVIYGVLTVPLSTRLSWRA